MVEKEVIIKNINNAINKCSKPHISSLPGDLRSNDEDLLASRLLAIEHDYAYLQGDLDNLEKELYSKRKDVSKLEKELDKTKKEFGKNLIKSYDKWKEYKELFEYREDAFIGIDYEHGYRGWSEDYIKNVQKEIDGFDKRVDDILNIDFDNISLKDYEKMDKLNKEITSFMKHNYDNESWDMEIGVWFKYADIFGQLSEPNSTRSLLKKGIEVKENISNINKEIDSLIEESNKKEILLQDYAIEYDRTEQHLNMVKKD